MMKKTVGIESADEGEGEGEKEEMGKELGLKSAVG